MNNLLHASAIPLTVFALLLAATAPLFGDDFVIVDKAQGVSPAP